MFSPFAFMGSQAAPAVDEYLFNFDFTQGDSYPGSGTSIYDLSNNYTGSIVNSPTYDATTGYFTLNGTSQYITVPHDSLMNFDGSSDIDLTIVTWGRNTKTTSPDTIFFIKGYFDGGSAGNAGNYSLYRAFNVNDRTNVECRTTDGVSDSNKSMFSVDTEIWAPNTWVNIVYQLHYNSTNNQTTGSLWVNNVSKSVEVSGGGPNAWSGWAIPNSASLELGRRHDGGVYWQGQMAVVKAIKSQWTSTEVDTYWNNTKTRFGY